MNNKKGDFHIHTSYSDGQHTTKEIFNFIESSKLDYFSITDHDNVDAILEISKILRGSNIKFIHGVELSTFYNGESIHILGYFKDEKYRCEDFLNKLHEVRNFRENRAKEIISKLKHYFNIKIDFKKVEEISKGIIARPHIAQCIVDEGYPYTYESVFKTVLHKSSPAYVATRAISTEEGIKFLKKYNAATFLAHPKIYKRSSTSELLDLGFDGIEAIYPLNKKEDTKHYINISKERNILISAGTDFHSKDRDNMHPAHIGEVYLSGEDLDKFLHKIND